MDRMRFPKTAALVLGLLLAMVAFAPGIAQQNDQAEVMLQAAQNKQLVDGDLDQAIQMYRKILSEYSSNRPVAAKALVEMGDCYEKLGKSGAEKAYQRVLHDYADQSAEANEARARLAALNHGSAHGNEMVARRIWSGPDVDVEGGVSANGRYLSYVDWDTGDLAVRDLITGQNRRVTHKGSWSDSEEYAENSVPSRDGRQVAYAWFNKDDFYELRIGGIDGAHLRTLYRNPKVEYLEPMSWSPDGKEIVGTFWQKSIEEARIMEVSVADGSARVLKVFKSRPGQRPLERFSPDGRFIAYDLYSGSKPPARDIWVVPNGGGEAIPLVQHPSDDYLLGWAPDGKSVIFASNRTGSYSIWDIEVVNGSPSGSPRLLKSDFGPGRWPLGISRDGSFYYGIDTSVRDLYIASFDFSSGKMLKPPALVSQEFTGRNTGGAWSPDGKYLAYFSKRHGLTGAAGTIPDTIVIRSVETGRERELVPKFQGMAWYFGVRWSADGRALFFTGTSANGMQGIFRVNVQTGKTSLLFKNTPAMGVPGAAELPTGNAFVLHRYDLAKKTQELVFDNLQSGQERILFHIADPVLITGFSISPGGREVAFTTDAEPGGTSVLRIVPVAGGEARTLVRLKAPNLLMHASGLAWTPDGSHILFLKASTLLAHPKTQLWEVSTQGGEPRNLGLAMSRIRHVHIHPDGHQIVFESDMSREEIWAIPDFLRLSMASR